MIRKKQRPHDQSKNYGARRFAFGTRAQPSRAGGSDEFCGIFFRRETSVRKASISDNNASTNARTPGVSSASSSRGIELGTLFVPTPLL